MRFLEKLWKWGKTERRMNYLVSKPNEQTCVYLRLSMLELSKTLMCELWYDYVIPKYGKKTIHKNR